MQRRKMKNIKQASKEIQHVVMIPICPLCGEMLDGEENSDNILRHLQYYECPVRPLFTMPAIANTSNRVYRDDDGDLWLARMSRQYYDSSEEISELVSITKEELRVRIDEHMSELLKEIGYWRDTMSRYL